MHRFAARTRPRRRGREEPSHPSNTEIKYAGFIPERFDFRRKAVQRFQNNPVHLVALFRRDHPRAQAGGKRKCRGKAHSSLNSRVPGVSVGIQYCAGGQIFRYYHAGVLTPHRVPSEYDLQKISVDINARRPAHVETPYIALPVRSVDLL